MLRHNRHIVSMMLVLILLVPAAVKLQHHHDRPVSHDSEDRSPTTISHKCLICDFQFSTFLVRKQPVAPVCTDYAESVVCKPTLRPFTSGEGYSFLLRAPPAFTLAW